MIYQRILIGIAGTKNSGKDTAASMINYILHKGVTNANYQEWIIKQRVFDTAYSYCIIHFADVLKDICSTIFGIERKLFDSRFYKDMVYYNLVNNNFLTTINNTYREITTNDLTIETPLQIVVKHIINENKIPCIKLRTILQYIGTDIYKNQISDNIWVNIAIRNAADIIRNHKYCIIPDVRFKNEANAITNYSYCKTALIKLKRENINAKDKDNHASENIELSADYEIDNTDTKLMLFYKILSIINQIIND